MELRMKAFYIFPNSYKRFTLSAHACSITFFYNFDNGARRKFQKKIKLKNTSRISLKH